MARRYVGMSQAEESGCHTVAVNTYPGIYVNTHVSANFADPYSEYICHWVCFVTAKIGSQSAIVNDSIFTYKFSRMPGENVGLECDGNMSEVLPSEYLLNTFSYIHEVVINCGWVYIKNHFLRLSLWTAYAVNLFRDKWCNESGVVKKERVPDLSYIRQYTFCQKSLPHGNFSLFRNCLFMLYAYHKYSVLTVMVANGQLVMVMHE